MATDKQWCGSCHRWLPPESFYRSKGCRSCHPQKRKAPVGSHWCGWCSRALPPSAFYVCKKGPRAGKPISGCIECRSADRGHNTRAVQRYNRTRTSTGYGKWIKWPCPKTWRDGPVHLSPPDVACMLLWKDGFRAVDGGILSPEGDAITGHMIKPRKRKWARSHRWYRDGCTCSRWQFAAFCYHGAAAFSKGVLVRARDGDFSNVRVENLYLQTRADMLRECVVRTPRTLEDPAPLTYSPSEDPTRAVQENQDLLKMYPRSHWEVVWLAMLEAARKYDPEHRNRKGSRIPLRGWMRYLIKKRIKDKMRRDSVRYQDDRPGYKLLRSKSGGRKVISTYTFEEEYREH